MAAKLKLMLKAVHWPSLIKALLLVLTWVLLPRVWFGAAAILVYLTPRVNLRRFFLLYAALICLAFAAPDKAMVWIVPYLGVGAYLALGIKELAIVDRFTAERALLTMLLPVLAYGVFRGGESLAGGLFLFGPFLLGAFVFLSIREILRERLALSSEGKTRVAFPATAAVLGGVLVTEMILAINFLPLPPLVQAALVLVVTAVILELLPAYAAGRLSRETILTASSLAFVLLILIFTVTPIDIHRLSPVP